MVGGSIQTDEVGKMDNYEEDELVLKMKMLIGLQNCDTRIRHLQIRKEQGPAKIQNLEQKLDEAQTRLDQRKTELEGQKRERRQAEIDIEDLENKIRNSNMKLTSVKSNREYRAALKEIEHLKAEKSRVEDRVIEVMEAIELADQGFNEAEAEREKLKAEVEADREEILKELQVLDQDLDDLRRERNRFCGTIEEVLLRRYDFLRRHKGGIAISPVTKGVCRACHMGIPPQQFNELIRCNELMQCPHCGRIMYWGEDERFQQNTG